MNILIKNKKLVFLTYLTLLLIIPFIRSSGTEVWSENFNSGVSEELSLFAWTKPEGEVFQTNNTAKPTIVNYALQMPNTREWGTWSAAQRNTTQVHGTWSFDFTVKEGDDHTACFGVFFISDMPWNSSGYTFSTLGLDGYYIALKSGSTDNVWWDSPDHNMNLGRHTSNNDYLLANYTFPDDVTGSHHIDITRKPNGEINVCFDSTLIISHVDFSIMTSEIFVIGAWSGDVSFDNFVVSDSIDVSCTTITTTTRASSSASMGIILGSFIVLIVIRRKNRHS